MAREARHFVDEAVLVRIFSSNLDNWKITKMIENSDNRASQG